MELTGIEPDDLLSASEALSQLSYSPKLVWRDSGPAWTRTTDLMPYQGMRSNHLSYKPKKLWYANESVDSNWSTVSGNCFQILLRKEVIQPHLPVRLPCYDFAPVTSLTLTAPSRRLGHPIRVLLTSMA